MTHHFLVVHPSMRRSNSLRISSRLRQILSRQKVVFLEGYAVENGTHLLGFMVALGPTTAGAFFERLIVGLTTSWN